MDSLQAFARESLDALDARHLRRRLRVTEPADGVHVLREGKRYISFSSNDYLGLSHHPEVVRAASNAAAAYGAGAGASRLVTGNLPLYGELETLLAEMKGTEAALVFGSGYLANLGTLQALAGKNDLVLADRLSHACMLDGAALSGATLMRFAHNSVEHARLLLDNHRDEFQHCILLTETVFSMDGDIAPLAELATLAQAHDAWLVTDDAHGLGFLPAHHAHVQLGTLSKAAGSYGGYVCASREVIDYLTNTARSLIFSTALPPAVLAGATAAITLICQHPEWGERALKHAQDFTDTLQLPRAQSAIVPVMLGEPERAMAASAMLEDEGMLVSAIRPPAVPPNTARLRFAFSALHEESQVARAAEALRRHGYA